MPTSDRFGEQDDDVVDDADECDDALEDIDEPLPVDIDEIGDVDGDAE